MQMKVLHSGLDDSRENDQMVFKYWLYQAPFAYPPKLLLSRHFRAGQLSIFTIIHQAAVDREDQAYTSIAFQEDLHGCV